MLSETPFLKHQLITYRILHTTLVLSMESYKPFFGYYFFNVLLMVLQGLHIFWAGLILRMVYKFQKGKVRISSGADMSYGASLKIHTSASVSSWKKMNAVTKRARLKRRTTKEERKTWIKEEIIRGRRAETP